MSINTKNSKIEIVLLILLAAVLRIVSFPRLNLFFTSFFFLVPLLYLFDRGKAKKAFLVFFSFSFLSYLGILYWIPGIMATYGNASKPLSYAGLIALSAFLSIFTGLAGVLIRQLLQGALSKKTVPWIPAKIFSKPIFWIPFIWVGKDFVVERVLNGFPWCLTGYSQHNNVIFSQVAEIGGVHLITFIIVFINVLFYLLLRDRSKRVLAALAICFLAVYSTGYFLYRISENKTAALTPHKAGIIQPNVKNEVLYTAKINRILKKLFNYSKELEAKGAEFVIWPEYTVPIYPMQSTHYAGVFNEFVTAHVPIIAGFNDFLDMEEFYNTAFLFKKDKVEKYYKVHLTPFGEYVPLRKMLFFVKNITSGIGDYTFGKSLHNFELDGHAISVPICYEVIFPNLIREFVAKGSELIVTISNDSWEGNTSGPRQILSMARFRCIETRRYMLRSTSTGISAAITPTGKLTYKSKWGVEDVFIADFKYIDGKTFFVRAGYLFPHLCFLVTLLFALMLIIGFFMKRDTRLPGA